MKRKYDNSKRTLRANLQKENLVILTLDQFRNGNSEVTFKGLANLAGISERHIYRLFGDKEHYAKIINLRMTSELGLTSILEQSKLFDVVDLFQLVYSKFDLNKNLVWSYLNSEIGSFSRGEWRENARSYLQECLKANGYLTVKSSSAFALKGLFSIFSAKHWASLAFDEQMSASEIEKYLKATVPSLLEYLRKTKVK